MFKSLCGTGNKEMKYALMVLIILGIIAAVAAVGLMYNEMIEAYQAERTAREAQYKAGRDRNKAIEEKKEAEKAKEKAEQLARQAEKEWEEARQKMSTAQEQAAEMEKERDEARQAQQEALEQKQQAFDERDAAQEAQKLAEEKQRDAEIERDVALAEQSAAEQVRDEIRQDQKNMLADYQKVLEVVGEGKEIAQCCTDLISSIFVTLDTADNYYMKGLERAQPQSKQTLRQKLLAIRFLNTARRDYKRAQKDLEKLELPEGNVPLQEIKELARRSIEDSLASLYIVVETLRKRLKREMPEEERIKRALEAAKKKIVAGDTLVEVCNRILELIDTYEGFFVPSQRVKVERLRDKINKMLQPEEKEESTPPSPKEK